MEKVRFYISMSLNGFITAANPRSEAGWRRTIARLAI